MNILVVFVFGILIQNQAFAAAGCIINGSSYSSGDYVCGVQGGNTGQLYVCVGTTAQPQNKSCCCSSYEQTGSSCTSNSSGNAGSGGGCVGATSSNPAIQKAKSRLSK